MVAQANIAHSAANGDKRFVPKTSRVGKRPIDLPKGIAATISGRKIEVKGPKGQLSRVIPDRVDVKVDGGRLLVSSSASGRDGARLQGLTRALIATMVKGSRGLRENARAQGHWLPRRVEGHDAEFCSGVLAPRDIQRPVWAYGHCSGGFKGHRADLERCGQRADRADRGDHSGLQAA
jgi:large subunit ribosomal protein L6